MRRTLTTGMTIGLLLALWTTPASAQLARLWEVSTALADADGQYVILRVQDLCTMDGLALVVEDAAGDSQGCFLRFEGPPPVFTGYVFISISGAEDVYGYPPDYLARCTPLARESGRICLVNPTGLIDCLAYGQFTGDNGPWGAPAEGLLPNQSLVRSQTLGLNQVDWQRSASARPGNLLSNRLLPPGGVVCTNTDGGSPPPVDGGLDPNYLLAPDGTLCPTERFGVVGSDGGTGPTTDGGTGPIADGGVPITGGGNSTPYERPSSCCNVSSGQTAMIFLPLGFLALWPRRRRGSHEHD